MKKAQYILVLDDIRRELNTIEYYSQMEKVDVQDTLSNWVGDLIEELIMGDHSSELVDILGEVKEDIDFDVTAVRSIEEVINKFDSLL